MKFVKTVLLAQIFVLPLFMTHAVYAGPYTDDLSKCIVESTTTEDRTELVKWMFTAMSLHPAVKQVASVSTEQIDEANKQIAALVVKLLTKTCNKQARAAIKYEGQIAIQSSFEILGQVAAKELFANKDVAAGLVGLGKNIDKKKLDDSLGIKQ